MPPKPKRGKTSKKEKKAGIPLDDVDTTILTREKLEEFCITVHEAFTKEKQYSEFLRLERDKLANMQEIAREQLASLRNSIRVTEHDLQEAEDNHRQLMGETRQQLIHLSSEKNIECLKTKLETVSIVSCEQKCHKGRMYEIGSDVNVLKAEYDSLNNTLSQKINNQEIEFSKAKYQLQEKDNELQILMKNKRDKIVNNEVKKLDQRFKEEHNGLEKRKRSIIAQLITRNTKFTTDLKHYYDKIVNHNLSVIYTMKSTFHEVKTATASINKELIKLRKENLYIVSNLRECQNTEHELKVKLISSKRDQTELKSTKLDLINNNALLDDLKLELDAVNMRFNKQEVLMSEDINEEQQVLFTERGRAEELILVLEYMVTHLCHRINETDAALGQLTGVETDQDTLLNHLIYELTTVAQQRDCMLTEYTQLLHKHHIHPDNTGFQAAGVDHILRGVRGLRVLVREEGL